MKPLQRIYLFGLWLLLCSSGTGLAQAAAPSLQGTTATRTLRMVVGLPEIGVGFWWDRNWGVEASWTWPNRSVGVAVGARLPFWPVKEVGWWSQGTLTLGATVPLLDPGIALAVTPGVELGWQSRWLALWFGLAAPMQFQFLPSLDAVFPVQLTLGLEGRFGAFRLGLALTGGPAFQAARTPMLSYQLSLLLGWQL